jgi:hypothetical protein
LPRFRFGIVGNRSFWGQSKAVVPVVPRAFIEHADLGLLDHTAESIGADNPLKETHIIQITRFMTWALICSGSFMTSSGVFHQTYFLTNDAMMPSSLAPSEVRLESVASILQEHGLNEAPHQSQSHS